MIPWQKKSDENIIIRHNEFHRTLNNKIIVISTKIDNPGEDNTAIFRNNNTIDRRRLQYLVVKGKRIYSRYIIIFYKKKKNSEVINLLRTDYSRKPISGLENTVRMI